jgi:formate dehydrogenase subunit gamma
VRNIAALLGAFAAFALVATTVPALAQDTARDQVQRQQVQPLNNAPVWRDVRSGDPAYTSVKGRETEVLIQPSGVLLPGQKAITAGENWRLARVPLATVGGVVVAIALLGSALIYFWKGPHTVHDRPTGRLIRRFSTPERAVHWSMGLSFVVLAASGLILTFGKTLLLPVFGYTLFAWLANAAKNTHNFIAPVFIVSVPIFMVMFFRDNLPTAQDLKWLKAGGGVFTGKNVPSGRFNAGEKLQYWGLVVFLGLILIVTGLILLFPNFDQSRSTMQLANVVHIVAAMLGIAMAVGHVFMGTVYTKGAYEGMRYGYVDETWAKEHHGSWYEDVRAGRSRQRFVDEVPAETAARVQASLLQSR